MDKSTHTAADLGQALRSCLDLLVAGRLAVYLPDNHQQPMADRHARPTNRGYALTCHHYPELLLELKGRARLCLHDTTLYPGRDRVHLLLPGLVHGETFSDSRRMHRLLWVAFTPGGANFFISGFDPAGGFCVLPERFSYDGVHASAFWRVAADVHAGMTDVRRAHLQGLLLCMISDALIELEKPQPMADYRRRLVEQIRQYIIAHVTEPLTVGDLAVIAGCTENYLNTQFRRYVGTPIRQFIITMRLELACQMLERGDMPVKQVAYRCGFRDPLYFSRLFRRRFDTSPSNYAGRHTS